MKHILPFAALVAMLFTGCATYEYRVYHGEKLAVDVEKDINELAKKGWRMHSFSLAGNGSEKYVVLERRR